MCRLLQYEGIKSDRGVWEGFKSAILAIKCLLQKSIGSSAGALTSNTGYRYSTYLGT